MLLLLVSPLLFNTVEGAPPKFRINSITVDDTNAFENRVILTSGETIQVRVVFRSNINSHDVRVQAKILGEDVSVSEDSDIFSVISGVQYTKLIDLTIPSDITEDTIANLQVEVRDSQWVNKANFKILLDA